MPGQLIRLIVVFAVLLGVLVATWAFVIPASLKDTELHKAAAVSRVAARPLRYAGAAVCRDCHDDEPAVKATGYHSNLSCETCHGPLYEHTEDPLEARASAPREREFCPTCHMYDASRPTGFPQINPVLHNPITPCIQCHDPHDPVPPEIPHECSACHGQIFNTKSLSPHALLECTTCHNTPEAHMETPRVVRPTKPMERAFCAQCHGTGSDRSGTPKVDLETHEPAYQCWQCHYPHMPGG